MTATSGHRAPPEGLDREVYLVAAVVITGVIMSVLDTTIVNVALETLSRELNAPLSTIQWVSTGYLLALAVVLAQPFADVVLSGAATPEALRSNLGAATLELPEEALDALATLEEPADEYWTARGELAWT